MKKIVLIYGLIAGAIVSVMLLITMPMYKNGTLNFDNGELFGYSTMVIALSLVFFGTKSYRDRHLNGIISFGKAVKVGLLISGLASLMYALSWEVSYSQIGEEFTKKMTEHYFEKMKLDGKTDAEIAEERVFFAKFAEMYKNPIIRFTVTVMEIFWVGVVITLLSAGLLRKKEFLPASSVQTS
jgi:Protein of unknown function (DUF4199)